MKSKFFNILSFVLVFTFAFSFSAIAQTSKEQPVTTSQHQTLQTVKFKVTGITCSGDLKDIQKEVTKINGVSACKPLGKAAATSVFEITFNPAVVSEKEIRKAVESTPGCDDPNARPYKVKQG
ncbi:MAG TPA: heavy-metal-associated domain-containing protein [Chitinophagaceae bacterium]|nr:heavy-metal-associated domain-containing protein [Chitinophagaceae bacterium]